MTNRNRIGLLAYNREVSGEKRPDKETKMETKSMGAVNNTRQLTH